MSSQEETTTIRQLSTADALRTRLSVPQEGAVPVIAPGTQLLFLVSEAREMLRMSRSEMYKHLRSGRIRSVGRGQARRITAWALLDYIDLLEQEARQ